MNLITFSVTVTFHCDIRHKHAKNWMHLPVLVFEIIGTHVDDLKYFLTKSRYALCNVYGYHQNLKWKFKPNLNF
jgi:hypothetical protein